MTETAVLLPPPEIESTPVAPPPARRARLPVPLLVGMAILCTIAVVSALYLARAFFVPLMLGILLSYALTPLVDGLRRWGIPRAGGAALVLAALIGSTGWAVVALGDDAREMVRDLPDAARKVREQVVAARAGGPTSMERIQEAATELQGAAADAAGQGKPRKSRAPPPEAEASPWLRDHLLAQSALLFTVAAQAPIVLLLTYFLLASGEHFRRKLVQLVGPSLSRKKDAVRILEEIDTQIQRYLLVTLASNVLLGICTWLAFEALGMTHAGVWGLAAGILHFIPYLGPVVFALASGVAAFVQLGTPLDAVAVAGVSLLLAILVGSFIMTWLQSRFARVNAAVLFIALLFFGWLWGVWGLLLGAPLLAIAKVVCDRVESLEPVGGLLGR